MSRSTPLALVFPSGHFFNTPCVPNLALQLGKAGFEVDVYLVRNETTPQGTLESNNVRLHWCPLPQRSAGEPGFFRTIWFGLWVAFRLTRKKEEPILIACGLRGLLLTGLITRLRRLTFVYNSLEVYSGPRYRSRAWRLIRMAERHFQRQAALIIIQDEQRAKLQSKVNGLVNRHFAFFPNSPLPVDHRHVEELVASGNAPALVCVRSAISRGERVLLYAGSLSLEWASLESLADMSRQLPTGWRMVMQSRLSDPLALARIRDLLRETNSRLDVFVEPLSVTEYQALVMMCTAGLAWYGGDDENLKYVGLSSGKIAQYWQASRPIVVNTIPVYDEVCPRFSSGVCVKAVDEIPAALNAIAQEYSRYSAGALQAYSALFDIAPYTRQLSQVIDRLGRAA